MSVQVFQYPKKKEHSISEAVTSLFHAAYACLQKGMSWIRMAEARGSDARMTSGSHIYLLPWVASCLFGTPSNCPLTLFGSPNMSSKLAKGQTAIGIPPHNADVK